MIEPNPYAPPLENFAVPVPVYREGMLPPSLEEARRRLDEHLAHAANTEADQRMMGPRIRTATWVALGLAGVSVAVLLAGFAVEDGGPILAIGAVLGVLFALVFTLLLVQDVRLERARRSQAPDAVLKSFFRALVMRPGLALTSLAPTGRTRDVMPPHVPPVKLGTGTFRLTTPAEVKTYARTFCRPGGGQARFLQVKHATVFDIRGDVAIVDLDLAFQSYPQWVQIVCVIAFAAVRLVGILLIAVLYFPLRKRAVARTRKALLRGRDGLWYVVDPSVIEGSAI